QRLPGCAPSAQIGSQYAARLDHLGTPNCGSPALALSRPQAEHDHRDDAYSQQGDQGLHPKRCTHSDCRHDDGSNHRQQSPGRPSPGRLSSYPEPSRQARQQSAPVTPAQSLPGGLIERSQPMNASTSPRQDHCDSEERHHSSQQRGRGTRLSGHDAPTASTASTVSSAPCASTARQSQHLPDELRSLHVPRLPG
ncbi:MAG: hypothetical protein QOG10_2971, partial [Kribbellaceae bacterium]|nr:hypothetical protein [Kribbellaceae bacterium]